MTELFDDVSKVVDALHGDVDPNLVYSKLEIYQDLADRVARVIRELSVGIGQPDPPFIDLTVTSDDDDEILEHYYFQGPSIKTVSDAQPMKAPAQSVDTSSTSGLPCSSGTSASSCEASAVTDVLSNPPRSDEPITLPWITEGCKEAAQETAERDKTQSSVTPLSLDIKNYSEGSLPAPLKLQASSSEVVQNAIECLPSTSNSAQCFLEPTPSTSRSEDHFLEPVPLISQPVENLPGPSYFSPRPSTSLEIVPLEVLPGPRCLSPQPSTSRCVDTPSEVIVEEPVDNSLSWIELVRAKQEAMRQVLLTEARSLYTILRKHTLGEIYAFLEYHMDDENRFQIVLEHFQHQDALSETPAMAEREEQPLPAEEGMDANESPKILELFRPPVQKEQEATKPIPDNEKQMLLGMFPDLDPEYLAEIPYENKPEWLNDTISHLLETDYRRRIVQEDRPISPARLEDVMDSQYQDLIAILPDADPTYLREQCRMMAGNKEAMKNFVAQALELHNYPTLKEYLKRKEIEELQDKYTKEFKVEEFLEIFPNPMKYFFEEKKNNIDVYPVAMSYLKKRYPRIRLTDIQAVFRKEKFSLTKACKMLDAFPHRMRTKRAQIYDSQAPTVPNIPFMQEVAFIENKSHIEEYLAKKAAAKKKAFEQAQAAGELKECGCCFAGDVLLEDMAACEEGHLFCKECVLRGTETQIGDGKTTFPCFSDCSSEFSLKTLKGVLKPSVFSRLLHRKQIEEVKAAGIPGLEICPFCDFATIPAAEDKVFHCLNPECMKNTCRLCKEPDHVPLRCDEVEHAEDVRMRTYIENRMTEALVRTCWECKRQFIKEDGCNKMRCACGAFMCYVCRKPVQDYSHFNPVGGTEFEKCPLFSDNDELHVTAVKNEAKKARNEVLNKNPGRKLKNDPTTILPEPSRKQAKPAGHPAGAAGAMPFPAQERAHVHHHHHPNCPHRRHRRYQHHLAMNVHMANRPVPGPLRAVRPAALQRLVYALVPIRPNAPVQLRFNAHQQQQ